MVTQLHLSKFTRPIFWVWCETSCYSEQSKCFAGGYYQYQARLAKDLAAYCGRSFGSEAANKQTRIPPPPLYKIVCIVARLYVPCNLALAPLILVNYSVQFYFLVRDMHCCSHVLTMTTPTNITSSYNMNTTVDIGVSRSGCNTE